MAAKALLYSADKLSVENAKESRCKSLVRQLLAIEIAKRIYQRVKVNPARLQPIPATLPIEVSGPSMSPRTGRLRWEPPKHKRDLKAHPWQNLVVAITDSD